MSKRIWLTKGTRIGCNLVESNPSYSGGSTMYVSAGKESTMSINGSTVWRAKGGISTTSSGPAPSGTLHVVTKNCDGSSVSHDVHWHMGNTDASVTFAGIVNSYTSPNASGWSCYTGSHVHHLLGECHHKVTCGGSIVKDRVKEDPIEGSSGEHTDKYVIDYHCSKCGASGSATGIGSHPSVPSSCSRQHCGDHKDGMGGPNHWVLHGIMHGQIMDSTNAPAVGSCYYASGWTPDSANVDSRQASFRISLTESQQLQMYSKTVRAPSYRNGSCHLILKDDTVTYFKR